MTAWTPQFKLTIAGVDYTTETLPAISHSSGRSDIYFQPRASQLQIELVDLDGLNHDFAINDSIALQVKNSANAWVNIFGGTITDIKTSVKKAGTQGYWVSYTIVALGALSKLTRATTNGVLSKDFDGNQIYSILSSLLYDTWSEVPSATTWATYDATTTWANASNSGIGEVDTPGDYELAARSSSTTNVYELVTSLAQSGLGYIYEDSQGRVGYADSTHRGQYLATYGYTELDAGQAVAEGMSITTKASDVRNSVTIIYKNNSTYTATDAGSIGIYGLLASNIQTSLENVGDATTQANFYLALRAYPQSNLSAMTFCLTNPAIDNADRDALINVFMGQPIDLSGLPVELGSNYQGFVEGWSWRTSYNNLYLTLYMTPIAYSLQAFKWLNVPATETWNTLNPTLIWQDATIVS